MRLDARPRHNPPGTLREHELRALWQLRTSLLRLKPNVDPEQDYRKFRSFVDAAHVDRVLAADGRPRAMFCHQRIDGSFAGIRYRLGLFEYGFIEVELRGHPSVAVCFGRQLISCRSPRPGVRNYFAGIGYPRSAVLLARAIPDLRIDGDPTLGAIERHLVAVVIERACDSNFDARRRVVELPTIPDPIPPAWRARLGDLPLLTAYEDKVPDWEQGRAVVLIGRLDGTLAVLGRELGRRVLVGARARLT